MRVEEERQTSKIGVGLTLQTMRTSPLGKKLLNSHKRPPLSRSRSTPTAQTEEGDARNDDNDKDNDDSLLSSNNNDNENNDDDSNSKKPSYIKRGKRLMLLQQRRKSPRSSTPTSAMSSTTDGSALTLSSRTDRKSSHETNLTTTSNSESSVSTSGDAALLSTPPPSPSPTLPLKSPNSKRNKLRTKASKLASKFKGLFKKPRDAPESPEPDDDEDEVDASSPTSTASVKSSQDILRDLGDAAAARNDAPAPPPPPPPPPKALTTKKPSRAQEAARREKKTMKEIAHNPSNVLRRAERYRRISQRLLHELVPHKSSLDPRDLEAKAEKAFKYAHEAKRLYELTGKVARLLEARRRQESLKKLRRKSSPSVTSDCLTEPIFNTSSRRAMKDTSSAIQSLPPPQAPSSPNRAYSRGASVGSLEASIFSDVTNATSYSEKVERDDHARKMKELELFHLSSQVVSSVKKVQVGPSPPSQDPKEAGAFFMTETHKILSELQRTYSTLEEVSTVYDEPSLATTKSERRERQARQQKIEELADFSPSLFSLPFWQVFSADTKSEDSSSHPPADHDSIFSGMDSTVGKRAANDDDADSIFDDKITTITKDTGRGRSVKRVQHRQNDDDATEVGAIETEFRPRSVRITVADTDEATTVFGGPLTKTIINEEDSIEYEYEEEKQEEEEAPTSREMIVEDKELKQDITMTTRDEESEIERSMKGEDESIQVKEIIENDESMTLDESAVQNRYDVEEEDDDDDGGGIDDTDDVTLETDIRISRYDALSPYSDIFETRSGSLQDSRLNYTFSDEESSMLRDMVSGDESDETSEDEDDDDQSESSFSDEESTDDEDDDYSEDESTRRGSIGQFQSYSGEDSESDEDDDEVRSGSFSGSETTGEETIEEDDGDEESESDQEDDDEDDDASSSAASSATSWTGTIETVETRNTGGFVGWIRRL